MPKKEAKAVLFDLDGVLVDSIGAWQMAYNEILPIYGAKPISKDGFSKIFGNTIEKNVKKIANIPKKEAYNLVIKFFTRNISHVKMFPEAEKILKRLSEKRIPIALISNSPRKIVMPVLNQFGLKQYFNAVITIEDVRKGKPAPDMVLKACRLLKVKPKYAIVVGDTVNDMTAGKKAGCITVGYGIKGDYETSKLDSITKFLN